MAHKIPTIAKETAILWLPQVTDALDMLHENADFKSLTVAQSGTDKDEVIRTIYLSQLN